MCDNCVYSCWSWARGEDGVDVASGLACLVRGGVKLSVQRLARACEASSRCNIPDCITDSVIPEVLIAAG